jgi:hypothetical protein
MSGTTFAEMLTRYGIKSSVEEHGLSKVGMWDIYGEDPNCDLGGSHHEPHLGQFYGTLEACIKYADNLPGFWSWGGGGRFQLSKVGTKAKTLMEFTNALTASVEMSKLKKLKGFDVWQRVWKELLEEDELIQSEQEVAKLMAQKQALDAKIAKLRKK